MSSESTVDAKLGQPATKVAGKEGLNDSTPLTAKDKPFTTPRGLMASTWHKNATYAKLLWDNPLKVFLYDLMYKGPHVKAEGAMPVHSTWAQHAFVFPRTLPPLIYQYWSMKQGNTWSLGYAMLVYIIYTILFSKMTIAHFNRLVGKYGTLDNKVARDMVPDNRVISTAIALIAYVAVRPIAGVLITFDPKEMPHLNWWLPVNVFIFTTLMDFYFYWYHRIMHEVDFLWRFHKTHHMTKHPTAILSAFADPEQDVFDIFVIPTLTLLTWRVDFFTWWICQMYILFVEASGHSGARIFIQAPVGSPILQWFDMDLALEDHDLHHRMGWRKSSNYGKQTRVWDKLFGSTRARVECVPGNIDWNNKGDVSDMFL